MKGKKVFTKSESEQIIKLIRQKLMASTNKQKTIRDKIRKLGFYASDFGIGGGYTEKDFLRVISIVGEEKKKKVFKENSQHSPDKKMVIETNSVKKFSFPPISNIDAEILVLGTMPGEKSLELNEYYGHGGNQFWKIMFACFNQPYINDYEQKKKLLTDHKIALWDVLMHCEREGSSDNNIKDEFPNDFDNFFHDHPNIKTLIFNGNNAYDYYVQYLGLNNEKKFTILPSTSPMNTWKTVEEKMHEWRNEFV
jgi:hypoxanthine-DNA glycosylase